MLGKDSIIELKLSGEPCPSLMLGNNQDDRLDAVSDEYAVIFRCMKAMDVDEIALHVSVLTGSPTYQVSIQGVDANGDPDGTIKGGGSPASVQWTPASTGLQWITLSNPYTVAANEMIAIVVEDGASGTNPDASNYIDCRSWDSQLNSYSPPFVSLSVDTGATWAGTPQDIAKCALRDSTATADVQGFPVEIVVDNNIVVTADDVAANGFVLPRTLGRRVQVHAVEVIAFTDTDYTVGIWTDDATLTAVAETATFDEDHKTAAGPTIVRAVLANAILDTGKKYYVGIKLMAAGVASTYNFNVVSADNRSAFSGYPNAVPGIHAGAGWVDKTDRVALATVLGISLWDPRYERIHEIETGIGI